MMLEKGYKIKDITENVELNRTTVYRIIKAREIRK